MINVRLLEGEVAMNERVSAALVLSQGCASAQRGNAPHTLHESSQRHLEIVIKQAINATTHAHL